MTIEIRPGTLNARCTIRVPGSKSYTHRHLIAAALSDGVSRIENPLRSEDTDLTAEALARMGVGIESGSGQTRVRGVAGRPAPCPAPLDLHNSGTSMRLLTAVAALGQGTYTLTGSARMQQRPIGDLLEALAGIGVEVRSLGDNGCPPLQVRGTSVAGGSITLNCARSSQFLSALLLIAPCTRAGLDIRISAGPVSRPYVDMTLAVMARFGVAVQREGYTRFTVAGGQPYRAGNYRVEPDASQAGYFWAAGALTGATVRVEGIDAASRQGDVGFVKVLAAMGCRVIRDPAGIAVQGGPLAAVDVDMGDMPDLVPTLAVVAAFARGTTRIRNVAHLKIKESDRLEAVARELNRMGIDARADADGLTVPGGAPRSARIDTYGDHRMAMSFALAGLRVPGMRIEDERCVEKSFPGFWDVLAGLWR